MPAYCARILDLIRLTSLSTNFCFDFSKPKGTTALSKNCLRNFVVALSTSPT